MSNISSTRAQWLAMLAKLTAPMDSAEAAVAFRAYIPMLADFPDAAFCHASLEAVAARCTKFAPSYGELRDALGTWWKQHRPVPVSLPEPVPELPSEHTEAEMNHVQMLARQTVVALESNETERLASYRKPNELPVTRREMTRAELTEAYKRAGLRGPAS